jgi:hypothetical protein
MVEQAWDNGLSVPIFVVVVSANGQVLAHRYDQGQEGLDYTEICEYVPEGKLVWPINVFFSDSTGRVMRAVIKDDDGQLQWVN